MRADFDIQCHEAEGIGDYYLEEIFPVDFILNIAKKLLCSFWVGIVTFNFHLVLYLAHFSIKSPPHPLSTLQRHQEVVARAEDLVEAVELD